MARSGRDTKIAPELQNYAFAPRQLFFLVSTTPKDELYQI